MNKRFGRLSIIFSVKGSGEEEVCKQMIYFNHPNAKPDKTQQKISKDILIFFFNVSLK